MKIKFEVEKTYKNKTYYPGIEYEMSEEMAKDILSKTKFAHIVADGPVIVSKDEELTEEIKNLKDDEVIEVETSKVIFEEVEKPKKKKKEIKKD